jgi:CoA:oxalate CoA-transferase
VPGAGDISRVWGLPFYDSESAYFVNVHRNKKSIEVDLKHPQGKELFFRLVGLDEMTDDPHFATNQARNQNREALIRKLQEVLLTKPYEAWETLFVTHGIPVGAINTIDSVVEHPQLQAREAIVEVEHPVAGPVRTVGVPVKLSETPGRVRAPAPLLGQHTDEVLQHYLDLNEAEIAALREAGAIGVKR